MPALKSKWVFIKNDEDFELYIKQPGYKTLLCSDNCYWEDIETGENCGTIVSLAFFMFNDDGTINPNCEREENHYRLVEKEIFNE